MASLMGLCCPANQRLNRETNGIKRVRRTGLQLYTFLCAMLYKYSLTLTLRDSWLELKEINKIVDNCIGGEEKKV